MRWFVGLGAIALAAALLQHSPCYAQEESLPKFLRPTSGSLVAAGWIEIAAVLPDDPGSLTLTLDGRPMAAKIVKLPAENPAEPKSSATLSLRLDFGQLTSGVKFSPAWVAVRLVAPGRHELRLGTAAAQFRAVDAYAIDKATSEALTATSTTLYVAHPLTLPGVVSCTGCHKLDRATEPGKFEDMTALFPPTTPDVCFVCHETAKFLPTHAHRVEHLAACQLCHDPHGANRSKLMKLSRQEACRKCHEYDR